MNFGTFLDDECFKSILISDRISHYSLSEKKIRQSHQQLIIIVIYLLLLLFLLYFKFFKSFPVHRSSVLKKITWNIRQFWTYHRKKIPKLLAVRINNLSSNNFSIGQESRHSENLCDIYNIFHYISIYEHNIFFYTDSISH